MREQLGQLLVEADLHGDDCGDRGGHRLGHVAGVERGLQLFLGFLRFDELDAHGTHIGRCGTEFGKIVSPPQQRIINRLVPPSAMRPGFAEDQVQALVIYF